jgi:hypothetical protein
MQGMAVSSARMAAWLCVLWLGVTASHAFVIQPSRARLPMSTNHIVRAGLHCRKPVVLHAAVGAVEVGKEVLALVKNTDMGANSTALPLEKRQKLYENLDVLEASAAAQGVRDLFGEAGEAVGLWTVDFVGETEAINEVRQKKSSAAGGYWRGELGRKIFRTEGLYQHVLEFKGEEVPPYARIGLQDAVRRKERALELIEEVEKMDEGEWDGFGPSPAVMAKQRGDTDLSKVGIGIRDSPAMQPTEFVAVNLVRVVFLNILPISIILVGLATRLNAENREAVRQKSMQSGRAARMQGAEAGALKAELPILTSNCVRVDFAPPIIAAGSPWLQRLIKLSIGPSTDVFLDTTFANANLRLGRGATSGSRFVFQKVREEDRAAAESWSTICGAPPALPVRVVGTVLKWLVLSRILAAAFAFYFTDPVTVKVICHGAPVLVDVLMSAGKAASMWAISGVGAWVKSMLLLALAVGISKSGGGIVQGEERSA